MSFKETKRSLNECLNFVYIQNSILKINIILFHIKKESYKSKLSFWYLYIMLRY